MALLDKKIVVNLDPIDGDEKLLYDGTNIKVTDARVIIPGESIYINQISNVVHLKENPRKFLLVLAQIVTIGLTMSFFNIAKGYHSSQWTILIVGVVVFVLIQIALRNFKAALLIKMSNGSERKFLFTEKRDIEADNEILTKITSAIREQVISSNRTEGNTSTKDSEVEELKKSIEIEKLKADIESLKNKE